MEEPKTITKSLKKKETEAIEDVATLTKKFKAGRLSWCAARQLTWRTPAVHREGAQRHAVIATRVLCEVGKSASVGMHSLDVKGLVL